MRHGARLGKVAAGANKSVDLCDNSVRAETMTFGGRPQARMSGVLRHLRTAQLDANAQSCIRAFPPTLTLLSLLSRKKPPTPRDAVAAASTLR